MRALRGLLWLALLPALLWCAGTAQAEPATLATAVNKAGYQRMLSQRIVKAYCQVGLGVMPQASAAQLAEALKTYDSNLNALQTLVPDQYSRELVSSLRQQWKPFKVVASGPATRAGAEVLLVRSERLLETAENLTHYLEMTYDTAHGHLVNLAGRQRMLSQRLAKFYMLHAWGFETILVQEEIEAAQNDFSTALTELGNAPENTVDIVEELNAVRLQWDWFRAALALEGAYSYRMVVADASESILGHMDHITRMYEELAHANK